MTKKVIKRKAKTEDTTEKKEVISDAVSTGISQLYYEMDTVRMQIKTMKDDELFDFCIPHIDLYKQYDLDKLYPKLIDGKPLDQKERSALEGFCILVNTDLVLVV